MSAPHLEATARILQREGPWGGGRRYPSAEVEAAAGVGRSSLLRLWPTVGELADAVAAHAAFGRPDWHRALVESDPSAPFEVSLAGALRRSGTATGVLYRTALRNRPPSALTEALRAWEVDALDRLAAWLSVHLAARGQRCTRGLTTGEQARLVAVLVEGWLQAEAERVAPSSLLSEPFAARCAVAVARLLRETSVADPTRPVPDDVGPWPAGAGGRPAEILEAVVARQERTAPGEPGGPTATRLVDPARLARDIGVSTRRIQAIWPTRAAQNSDIVGFLTGRTREASDALHQRAIARVTRAVSRPADPADDGEVAVATQFASVMTDIVELQADPAVATSLACTPALVDAEVAERRRAEILPWQADVGVTFLAGMQLFRYRHDPEVDVDVFSDQLFAATMGGSLMARTHPELRARRIRFGVEMSLAGVGAIMAMRGLTDAYATVGPTRWWLPDGEP